MSTYPNLNNNIEPEIIKKKREMLELKICNIKQKNTIMKI